MIIHATLANISEVKILFLISKFVIISFPTKTTILLLIFEYKELEFNIEKKIIIEDNNVVLYFITDL